MKVCFRLTVELDMHPVVADDNDKVERLGEAMATFIELRLKEGPMKRFTQGVSLDGWEKPESSPAPSMNLLPVGSSLVQH